MRILHVHSGNLYGGVETILTTLARKSATCPELEQEFALCFDGRLQRELATAGAATHRIGPVRVSRPLTVIRARRELRRLLAGRKFDVLVFHSAWSHAIFARVASEEGVPAVVWMHGTTGGRHWSERWSRRVPPRFIVCNSSFTASQAAKVYPETSRRVFYCPVELDSPRVSQPFRNTLRAELDTPQDAVVIIQVSRIEAWKGHLLHLEALSQLKDVTKWICWLVGGPQQSREEQYFEQMHLTSLRLGIADRVRFLRERADVPQLLRAADIYCQPNVEPEPFGITLVEALSAGLPAVTTSIGGANEIVDETCGLRVPPRDVADLAMALRRLIRDADLRKHLGGHGPARARQLCDPVTRISEFHQILTSCV